MSRTIITNSGSSFLTNISAEKFLGEICRDIGGVFFFTKYGSYETVSMSYSMTKEETLYVSNSLKMISNIDSELEKYYKKYKHFFGDDINIEEFKESLLYYSELFEKSEGYECI